MPRKYRTNKGTREFDDKLTREEIEAQLIGEGVTEYEPLTSGKLLNVNPSLLRGGEQFSGNTGNEAFASPDLPLSAGSAAASIARAGASRAVAGRAMSAIPHPVAKILGGILAYTGTDQVGQEAQSRFLGERPKGAIEQIVEPENEVVGRLMGTAENAAIDWGAGKVVDAGINAAKGIYNKFFPTLAPIPPKVGVTGHSFSEDPIKDAQYWDIPNPKPAQPSIAGYGNDAAAAEYAMLKAKPTDQLSSAERLRLAGIERKLLGEKTKTIDLPGQTIHMGDGIIRDPSKLLPEDLSYATKESLAAADETLKKLGVFNAQARIKALRDGLSRVKGGVPMVALLGSDEERKNKLNTSQGPILEFEVALEQPIKDPKVREDLRSYFIQSRLQAGNFKEAMNESAAAALYTPKERAELGAFFKTVDEKKLPSDIQLGPKGITISGPMAQEAGLGAMALGFTFYELSKRILLRKGSSAAAKAIGDYISGNAQKIPARKMGKYFLRNALRGADVLIQTADGEKQMTVE